MLDRPIFVIGPGRSGSTAFFHTFSQHTQLSWLTGILNRYPQSLWLNRLALQALSLPAVGQRLASEGRLGGGEVYDFWRAHLPNFARSPRDLVLDDVPAGAREALPALLSQTMIASRPRLMTKLTGWSRIGYLNTIFPDAKFINVVRDGRAVAFSYLNVDFWRGREGPDRWRWGPLTDEQQARWEAVDCSLVGLAGLNWEILMDATTKAAAGLAADRYMVVSYESMCADPVGLFRSVCRFCDIDWSPQFEAVVAAEEFVNRNERYKDKLSRLEVQQLETILAASLPRHGYSSESNMGEEADDGL